ncbi:MAG: hypothetical protein K8823_1473 [Cenarchaeum symbiont of Oopsacas minuta]|nr:hypothetical protein [Cenarchaeum symbiont of Oopsacas minuta]
MPEIIEFAIQQIIDNGKAIQISLVENVNTEPISQKQMIRESVIKNIDKETKDHVMPLLDAILQAQPTIKMKSYQHTTVTITMPKSRYDGMGRPQVGQIMNINIQRSTI